VKNTHAKLRFFSRDRDGASSGVTSEFDGCGASLLNLSKIDTELLHFDPLRNQTGGEDDALCSALYSMKAAPSLGPKKLRLRARAITYLFGKE